MVQYKVEAGDCLASIAARFKTTWNNLWDANPALRELRKGPGILYPGDVVEIPTQPRTFILELNKCHVFVVRKPVQILRVRFVGAQDVPYARTRIRLEFDDGSVDTETDDDGVASFQVPADAKSGKVFIGADEVGFPVRLGELDPCDTDTGVQARLRHLGYYMNEVDNDIGPWTRQALRAFQLDHGLEPTGEIDAATITELERRSGV